MSSSTLLSAGCTKKIQLLTNLRNAHIKNWILLWHLDAQCKTQCQGARTRSSVTWSPTIPAGSNAAAGATIANKNKQLQRKVISLSHKQGTGQPSLTFPVSWRFFFMISLPRPSITAMLEETAKCKQQSRNHKQRCNEETHTHTHTHTRTYFTSFKKLLCFQVQGREPLGGNYWLLAISLAKEAS